MAWINLESCYVDDDRLSCSILDDRVMADLKECEFITNVCVL